MIEVNIANLGRMGFEVEQNAAVVEINRYIASLGDMQMKDVDLIQRAQSRRDREPLVTVIRRFRIRILGRGRERPMRMQIFPGKPFINGSISSRNRKMIDEPHQMRMLQILINRHGLPQPFDGFPGLPIEVHRLGPRELDKPFAACRVYAEGQIPRILLIEYGEYFAHPGQPLEIMRFLQSKRGVMEVDLDHPIDPFCFR